MPATWAMQPMGGSEQGASAARLRWPWLAGAAVLFLALLALGTWQVQRLAWKHDLIARVDARIHAPPAAAPNQAQWPEVNRASHEYLRVHVTGRFLHEHEALVQATTALGAGFWVLTPLRTGEGRMVWINRGFVPPAARDPARRGLAPPEGDVSVTGLLRLSEPGGAFLRDNDPGADRWHSRDVAALTQSRGLPPEEVAPYFIDQEAAPGQGPLVSAPQDAGPWPVAGLTVVRFSDNHLVYALTWYGLALGLLAALVYVWRGRHRVGAG
ncbi:MAG: SURF1 family protein [Ottowia sp.]|uniref:SURF1 family protein n=1 Tax=Ottowia sp. TaxID=1898956 RepID=UPI003C74476E